MALSCERVSITQLVLDIQSYFETELEQNYDQAYLSAVVVSVRNGFIMGLNAQVPDVNAVQSFWQGLSDRCGRGLANSLFAFPILLKSLPGRLS